MIRAFYGLTQNPFDLRELELLPQQQEIHDTLKVHCQQGGLCLVLGVPGSGKSVIKQSLQRLPEKQYLVAVSIHGGLASSIVSHINGLHGKEVQMRQLQAFAGASECPGS
jgi:ABC-type transporter Mla maintaining outer membrane lipid asymmetry ATPase subunit MlaF